MNANNKPHAVGSAVALTRRIPGTQYVTGDKCEIFEVRKNRNEYRYRVNGGVWIYHDDCEVFE